MRLRCASGFARSARPGRWIAVLLIAVAGGHAAAMDESAGSPTPLLDYAQQQDLPRPAFERALTKRLAGITAELERNPPPPEAECARTLGAARFARLYEDLGSVHSSLGESADAAEAYEKALACTPRAPWLHAELAAELLNLGRIADARAAAQRGLAVDRDDASLRIVLSQLDFIEEHWADAVARFKVLAVTEPDDRRATYWQCFLWLAQRRAGTRHPELASRDAYQEWPAPILEALRGNLTEADLVAAIEDEPNERRRREMLAEALYYMGQKRLADADRERARRYFAAAVSLKVLYFIEHHMALAELEKMRADQY